MPKTEEHWRLLDTTLTTPLIHRTIMLTIVSMNSWQSTETSMNHGKKPETLSMRKWRDGFQQWREARTQRGFLTTSWKLPKNDEKRRSELINKHSENWTQSFNTNQGKIGKCRWIKNAGKLKVTTRKEKQTICLEG